MTIIKLRPHHLLDIITTYGHSGPFGPHPYGHAVHIVAKRILCDTNLQVELVVGADDICRPCKHLGPDGLCDDVLAQLDPPMPKQEYNDDLDRRLLAYLGLAPGAVMTVRQFLQAVSEKTPGIEAICTHPKRSRERRLRGLTRGLIKLGVRREEGQQRRIR